MIKIGYTVKQGIKQVFRNRTMTLAATFAITAMLLILGIFFILIVNINSIISGIKDDYNTIEIFLDEELTTEQVTEIETEVKSWDNVESTEYRTEEEAMEILKERWGDNAYLLDSLGENPLPSSICVSMIDLEFAEDVAEKATDLENVESVAFYKDTVDNLLEVTNGLQIGAVVLMAFLIIVSVVVVSNTIKLTVLARSEEINIMKYIGATNWFIRGPFLIEGIGIGLISALISAGCLLGLYYILVRNFVTEILAMISTSLVSVNTLLIPVLVIFVGLGLFIGIWGSLLSMRRFLNK